MACGAAVGALFAAVGYYHRYKTATLELEGGEGSEIKQANMITYRLLCFLQKCNLSNMKRAHELVGQIIDNTNRFYDIKIKVQYKIIQTCTQKHRDYANDRFQTAYSKLRYMKKELPAQQNISPEIAFYAGDLCTRVMQQLAKDFLNFMDTCDRQITKQHTGISLPY